MGCGNSKSQSNSSKNAPVFHQTLAIIRHSERLDQVDPSYLDTEEGKTWPFDTPLTENGIKLAHDVGVELQEVHARCNFAVIVSSPYQRCLQTAAEIAKVLQLPVLIDQEIGEVWDDTMPSERPPHRPEKGLEAMAKELGLQLKNPPHPDGGIKMFGKPPQKWPETIEDGHKRCIIRMEHYIEQSDLNSRNYIIVSHAPMVAAMMDIFQRGMCDVEKLDYCARVIASRKLDTSTGKKEIADEQSAFAANWDVDFKGVSASLNLNQTEDDHNFNCKASVEAHHRRKVGRTATDHKLAAVLKNVSDA